MSRMLALALVVLSSLSASVSSADRAPAADIPVAMPMRPPMPSRAEVRARLAERRAANLAAFHAYRTAGVYPSNVYQGRKLNVWRDDDGHLCAAATIINADGQAALVQATADSNNFIRLRDVKDGPLMDWMLTSGLTQAEIVMIQEPMMPVSIRRPEVNPNLRRRENQRLQKLYGKVEARLRKQEAKALEQATDALMAHPELVDRLMQS